MRLPLQVDKSSGKENNAATHQLAAPATDAVPARSRLASLKALFQLDSNYANDA